MLGSIIGDISGSHFEFRAEKGYTLPLYVKNSSTFTDDTVLTLATIATLTGQYEGFCQAYRAYYHRYCSPFSNGSTTVDMGYGSLFTKWALSNSDSGYKSIGNGAAMRVAPIAYYCTNIFEGLRLAKESAEATHNTPEGIASAQIVTAAIFLSRLRIPTEEIASFCRQIASSHLGVKNPYAHSYNVHQLHKSYKFTALASKSVPQAVHIGLSATSFEDAIRKCLYIGGDTDTIASIAGAIAEARHNIPEVTKNSGTFHNAFLQLSHLRKEDFNMLMKFYNEHVKNNLPSHTKRRFVTLTYIRWWLAEKTKIRIGI